MHRSSLPTTVALLVGVAAGAASAKGPSYAEKMACQHMLEYLDEAEQILGKTPLDYFTTADGEKGVEARVVKAKQEQSRCPQGMPEHATAQERLAKLQAGVAEKKEQAKALAPGAKKVTAAVKAWLGRLQDAQQSEPLAFQDPAHRTVVALKADLDALDAQLAKAGNPEHADAKEAAAALADAKAKLQGALDGQRKAVEALGDWKAKAKALSEKLDGRYVMQVPIDDRKVDAWIDLLAESQADLAAAEALQQLVRSTVKDVTDVPEYKSLKDLVWTEKGAFERETTNWYSNFLSDIRLADVQKVDFEKLNIGVDGFNSARRAVENGISAAKHKERYLRLFRKDDAGAAEAAAEVKQFEDKLARLDATEDKLLDGVRMPKGFGTAEMQKLMKQVVASKDFVAQQKNEGNTLLRAVVLDKEISHTKTREWFKGRWYVRDFDSFSCMAALKNSTNKKTWLWMFDVRYARSELPEIKTGVWTFGSWHRMGPIREANVNK